MKLQPAVCSQEPLYWVREVWELNTLPWQVASYRKPSIYFGCVYGCSLCMNWSVNCEKEAIFVLPVNFFFFFKHKSFFVSEPLELNRKTKTTAVINATWQHFFSFLSQMRTLQPISGIPRIGEWLAHKKDKSYGELNLAPILWNVSTYLSGRRQACLSVKASQQDGAWYLFCPTLWCTKGVDGVTLRGSIFQGVCWTS